MTAPASAHAESRALIQRANAGDRAAVSELLRAARALTPNQRAVVAHRFLSDMSVAETARATGLTASAVVASTHRATRKLAALLSPTP